MISTSEAPTQQKSTDSLLHPIFFHLWASLLPDQRWTPPSTLCRLGFPSSQVSQGLYPCLCPPPVSSYSSLRSTRPRVLLPYPHRLSKSSRPVPGIPKVSDCIRRVQTRKGVQFIAATSYLQVCRGLVSGRSRRLGVAVRTSINSYVLVAEPQLYILSQVQYLAG